MVMFEALEKERFRYPHPQLYSQGYQSVQVKWLNTFKYNDLNFV